MKHYVYKITFPGMPWFYYGVHMDNGKPYFGSPKTHKWRWDFYEHEITILEWFETREEAESIERRIISHFLNHPDCLNECSGAMYSLDSLRKGALTRNQLPVKDGTREKLKEAALRRWKDPDLANKMLKGAHKGLKRATESAQTERAKTKRKQTFEKIQHQQGSNNSQFGTMWITDGVINRKIKRGEEIPAGFTPGRKT
jgi:hypothetical protein